ncbi:hypothetical protein H0H93_014136, partial [Arthromyces matolae]
VTKKRHTLRLLSAENLSDDFQAATTGDGKILPRSGGIGMYDVTILSGEPPPDLKITPIHFKAFKDSLSSDVSLCLREPPSHA